MFFEVPIPKNEPVMTYERGSKQRETLQKTLAEMHDRCIEIPAIIGGKEIFSGKTSNCIEPHNHKHVIGQYHKVGEPEIQMAVKAAVDAQHDWENMAFYHRSAIFLKAADLQAGKEVIVGTLSHKPGSAGFLSWVLFNEGTEQPVEVMEVKAGIT